MEALGGAASVTAIVTIAFQSIQVIHDVVCGIRNGPDQIRRLSESIEYLREILDQIRGNTGGDASFVHSMKICAEDLEAFKIKLRKLKTPGETRIRTAWEKVVMFLKREEFEEMQIIIQRHCTALSLRLNTSQRYASIVQGGLQTMLI